MKTIVDSIHDICSHGDTALSAELPTAMNEVKDIIVRTSKWRDALAPATVTRTCDQGPIVRALEGSGKAALAFSKGLLTASLDWVSKKIKEVGNSENPSYEEFKLFAGIVPPSMQSVIDLVAKGTQPAEVRSEGASLLSDPSWPNLLNALPKYDEYASFLSNSEFGSGMPMCDAVSEYRENFVKALQHLRKATAERLLNELSVFNSKYAPVFTACEDWQMASVQWVFDEKTGLTKEAVEAILAARGTAKDTCGALDKLAKHSFFSEQDKLAQISADLNAQSTALKKAIADVGKHVATCNIASCFVDPQGAKLEDIEANLKFMHTFNATKADLPQKLTKMIENLEKDSRSKKDDEQEKDKDTPTTKKTKKHKREDAKADEGKKGKKQRK